MKCQLWCPVAPKAFHISVVYLFGYSFKRHSFYTSKLAEPSHFIIFSGQWSTQQIVTQFFIYLIYRQCITTSESQGKKRWVGLTQRRRFQAWVVSQLPDILKTFIPQSPPRQAREESQFIYFFGPTSACDFVSEAVQNSHFHITKSFK